MRKQTLITLLLIIPFCLLGCAAQPDITPVHQATNETMKEFDIVFINNSDVSIEQIYIALSETETSGTLGIAEISAHGQGTMRKGEEYYIALNYDNMPFLKDGIIKTLCIRFYRDNSSDPIGCISANLDELWSNTILCTMDIEVTEIKVTPES